MTTNGLTKQEESGLRQVLLQLDAIEPRVFLMGGNEQRALYELRAKIKNRLEPIEPHDLHAEAQQFFTTGECLDWFQAALKVA